MLSIIVCSRSVSDFNSFSENVAQTIGCPHETIRIDNSANSYSISQACNEGARRSRYSMLCFVHEDVAFHTPHWGPVLVSLLEIKEIGLVGVAGGTLKTKATGPAWWSPVTNALRLNLIQQRADGTKEHLLANPANERCSQVVAVDGVCMACRKEVWEQFPFDEQTVKGFHYYDLDFSLAIGGQYQVVVTYDILLTHFSEGRNDRVWAEQADIVTAKWKNKLPRYTIPLSREELQEAEYRTADLYLQKLLETGVEKALLRKYVMERLWHRPLDWRGNLYFLKKAFGKGK